MTIRHIEPVKGLRIYFDDTKLGVYTINQKSDKEYFDEENNLMTREEAIKRVTEVYSKYCPASMSKDNAKFQIAIMETLKVIKFKEENEKIELVSIEHIC